MILWHEFVRHALESPDSRSLLALFTEARASDEHFLPTFQATNEERNKFPAVMDAMQHIAWSNGTPYACKTGIPGWYIAWGVTGWGVFIWCVDSLQD